MQENISEGVANELRGLNDNMPDAFFSTKYAKGRAPMSQPQQVCEQQLTTQKRFQRINPLLFIMIQHMEMWKKKQ